MRSGWNLVIVTYVGVALAFGLIIGLFNLPKYKLLKDHGRRGYATVSATECDNHGTIIARFSVGGSYYSVQGSAGWGNPDCAALQVGDTVVVYYLPSDPEVCEPGDIRGRWTNEVISVVVGPLWLALVPAFSVWRRVVRSAKSGQVRS